MKSNSPKKSEMPKRRPDWCFGTSSSSSDEQRQWWKSHEPTVDKWLKEMEAASDPWWQSAEHAAYCLVSSPDMDFLMSTDTPLTWDNFSVSKFLFIEQIDGGTTALFGSVEIFFDQLVEALRRFTADGLIDAKRGEGLLKEMHAARADFLRVLDPATSDEDAMALMKSYWPKNSN